MRGEVSRISSFAGDAASRMSARISPAVISTQAAVTPHNCGAATDTASATGAPAVAIQIARDVG